MKTIGLLSDTHGYIHPRVFEFFKTCDEIWHAGDFGNLEVIEALQKFKPLKGVYGNIDGPEIQHLFPEQNIFTCEKVKVYMQHIGGYPGKYATGVKNKIKEAKPKIFISGHSHILKIMYDETLQCLHMNPGAAGNQGWHKVKTLVRFVIDGENIKDCEIIELGARGA